MSEKKADKLTKKNEKKTKKDIKENYKMGIEYYEKVDDNISKSTKNVVRKQ